MGCFCSKNIYPLVLLETKNINGYHCGLYSLDGGYIWRERDKDISVALTVVTTHSIEPCKPSMFEYDKLEGQLVIMEPSPKDSSNEYARFFVDPEIIDINYGTKTLILQWWNNGKIAKKKFSCEECCKYIVSDYKRNGFRKILYRFDASLGYICKSE